MESSPTTPAYRLKSELARACLPSANGDRSQKLAWTNSVCLLFLVIGLAGARRGLIAIRPAPPMQEVIPVVVQPVTLPPEQTVEKTLRPDADTATPAPVAVVMPQMPNIRFSVPTIGSLVVPANLAAAPPLKPLRPKSEIGSVTTTGAGGDRPAPPYPQLAKQAGEQGTVVLLLAGDDAGNVATVTVKQSSGYPLLDRATADFLKRHWRLPTTGGAQLFQTSVTYELQF